MKNSIILGLLSTILILGCTQNACSSCPAPGTWSACNELGLKIRSNYLCSSETGFECRIVNDSAICATSITASNNGLNVVISPTIEDNAKGIIKIEATSLPMGTTKVVFMMSPQNEPINMSAGLTSNQLFAIEEKTTDWNKYVDTTGMANGVYNIAIMATYEGAPDSSPWIGIIQEQIIIDNE